MDSNTPPHMDFNQFRKEVEARLRQIGNPRVSSAFALRVALANLPMLAHQGSEQAKRKEFLWYWPEGKREEYLLAVCRALQVGWSLVSDSLIISFVEARADYAKAADVTKVAADVAIAYENDARATDGTVRATVRATEERRQSCRRLR
uniref:Uncharacterized protein n=1 Tax=Candidatus Kentrum sp. TUN TaxID=2126343 RepID=A0A451A9P5_9GAMM|nr:MAG: hypothetical protein BECKTUN1418D_GA0071000_11855 [Candidatus Kentron sp. TUN]